MLTGVFRKKTTQLRTDGATSVRASVGALWGPKQLDNLVDLDLSFEVIPEKSVLRRRREDGSSIGNRYVFRSLDLTIPTLFFTRDLILSHFHPIGLVRYALKVSYPNSPLVPAAQGPTASSFLSTGGRARLPRSKKGSTKFIVRLMPTRPLLSLQTSSCRLVCQFSSFAHVVRHGSKPCADSCDINVSPDKRTILLHSENNLIEALKVHPLNIF